MEIISKMDKGYWGGFQRGFSNFVGDFKGDYIWGFQKIERGFQQGFWGWFEKGEGDFKGEKGEHRNTPCEWESIDFSINTNSMATLSQNSDQRF